MAHQGEAVPLRHRQPDEPAVGGRELGGCHGGGSDGVERDRRVHVCAWDGPLLGPFRHPVSAAAGEQLHSGDAPAGFLSIHCRPEHGQLGMGLHLREIRHFIQDVLLPRVVPFHVPGVSTDIIQGVNEKIQRGVVGIFISYNSHCNCLNKIRTGSEEKRSTHPNALSLRTLTGCVPSSLGHHRHHRQLYTEELPRSY